MFRKLLCLGNIEDEDENTPEVKHQKFPVSQSKYEELKKLGEILASQGRFRYCFK